MNDILVERAMYFAIGAHEAIEHVRKYTGEPYWHHCREVAAIIRNHAARTTPEMIAAAWLHDTVEDTGVSLAVIQRQFGAEVAALVGDLTDISKPEDGNRAKRKAIDRQHTAAASPDAKTVKLADLISNSASILARDPDFAKVYLREKELLLEVLTEGDATLWSMAATQITPLLALKKDR